MYRKLSIRKIQLFIPAWAHLFEKESPSFYKLFETYNEIDIQNYLFEE